MNSVTTTGAWTGTQPIYITTKWQRCSDPILVASCEDITGAQNAWYAPTVVDVDAPGPYYLRSIVTGTNLAGSASQASQISANPVGPGYEPSNTTPPSVVGPYALGSPLSVDLGVWVGTDPTAFNYSYQWRQCDSGGGNCHDIIGATAYIYTPTVDDVGHQLEIRVQAHNLVGVSPEVSSGTFGPVTP